MGAKVVRQESRALLLAAQRELENRRKDLARMRAGTEQRPINESRDAGQRPLVQQESVRGVLRVAAEQWPIENGRDAEQRRLAWQESREPAETAVSWQLYNAQKDLVARRERARRGAEGWGSRGAEGIGGCLVAACREPQVGAGDVSTQVEVTAESVRVYPTLATAVLRAELAAAGRVYWLLRYVDGVGRGWLAVQQIREVLTGNGSALRVCGWRRLRQLLAEGERKLWERDSWGRLWLYSPARILEQLEGGRLEGQPVAVPVVRLLGGIGALRAYLYATFHAGRRESRPITRETIRGKTAVSATTQRRYEQIAQIQVQANVALDGRWDAVRQEQAAWERGRAVFEFVDGLGEMGAVNGRYIAWRLGNCYESGLVHLPKGRQKKLNRRLPLVIDGRGGREMGIERLYYPNGKLAARAATRRPARDHYFPTARAGGSHVHMEHVSLWHVMGGNP